MAFREKAGVEVADMGGTDLAAAADDGGALGDPLEGEVGVFLGRQVVAVGKFLHRRRVLQEIAGDMGKAVGIGAEGFAHGFQGGEGVGHRLGDGAVGEEGGDGVMEEAGEVGDGFARAEFAAVAVIDGDREPDGFVGGLRADDGPFGGLDGGGGLDQDQIDMGGKDAGDLGVFRAAWATGSVRSGR